MVVGKAGSRSSMAPMRAAIEEAVHGSGRRVNVCEKKTRLTRGETRLGFVYDRLMCRVGSLAVGAIQKVFGSDPFGGGIPVSGLASGAHGGTLKCVWSLTVTLNL
jgi:hypothetical protein